MKVVHGPTNPAAANTFREMGARAYAAGLKPDACALKPGSRARVLWIEGFHDARKAALAKASAP
jgi:hypothetical protein